MIYVGWAIVVKNIVFTSDGRDGDVGVKVESGRTHFPNTQWVERRFLKGTMMVEGSLYSKVVFLTELSDEVVEETVDGDVS